MTAPMRMLSLENMHPLPSRNLAPAGLRNRPPHREPAYRSPFPMVLPHTTLLPQTTLDPQLPLLPQTTLLPHTTLLPLTKSALPQTTFDPHTTLLPQISPGA